MSSLKHYNYNDLSDTQKTLVDNYNTILLSFGRLEEENLDKESAGKVVSHIELKLKAEGLMDDN